MAELVSARVTLPASGSVTAEVEVVRRERSQRTLRAAVILGAALIAMPLVVFVPPHIPWPLLALAAGLYFARREWLGEYEVRAFDGTCPRCGELLDLEAGARIRSRERLECYSCHREPVLVLEPADG